MCTAQRHLRGLFEALSPFWLCLCGIYGLVQLGCTAQQHPLGLLGALSLFWLVLHCPHVQSEAACVSCCSRSAAVAGPSRSAVIGNFIRQLHTADALR
jgi:hypothetical protein